MNVLPQSNDNSQSPKGFQSLPHNPSAATPCPIGRWFSAQGVLPCSVMDLPSLAHGFLASYHLSSKMYRRPKQKGASWRSWFSCSFWGSTVWLSVSPPFPPPSSISLFIHQQHSHWLLQTTQSGICPITQLELSLNSLNLMVSSQPSSSSTWLGLVKHDWHPFLVAHLPAML